jgi:plasmid replication initiation protein
MGKLNMENQLEKSSTKSNNRSVIKLSNNMNNFHGKFTTLELQFIFLFISLTEADQDDFIEHNLKLSVMEKMLNKRLQLSKIDYIFDSLMQKFIKIKDGDVIKRRPLFSKIDHNLKENTVLAKFHDDLKPFLLNIQSKYTIGELSYIAEFKSEYSIRIYMFMKQWLNIGRVVFKIEELREIFELPETYKYNDFKRYALLKAQEEIKKSNIYFDFNEIKDGNKVEAIEFIIHRKNDIDETNHFSKNIENDDISKYIGMNVIINNDEATIQSIGKGKTLGYYKVFFISIISGATFARECSIQEIKGLIRK